MKQQFVAEVEIMVEVDVTVAVQFDNWTTPSITFNISRVAHPPVLSYYADK